MLQQEGRQCLLFLKKRHSLNLCGAHSAESSTKAAACAGVAKTVYNLLCSIPKSQDTQQRQDGNSLSLVQDGQIVTIVTNPSQSVI